MIYKWNEISLDMFKDVFDAYWRGDDWTCDKVLEIQNPIAIKSYWSDSRIYFGKGIDINEWSDWNKESLRLINSINPHISMKSLITNQKISMCLLEGGPRITPLGSVGVHYNLIWNMCFGADQKISSDLELSFPREKSLCLWYTKEDGKYIIDPYKYNDYDNFTKMIRVRSIDLVDWKEMMKNYTKTNDISYLDMSNDIPKQSIVFNKIDPDKKG